MLKRLIYLILLMLVFDGCEEYYKPVIDVMPGSLVVESRMTNDTTQNFVRLSVSRDFYSTAPVVWVTGAHVELVESKGGIMQALEKSPGYYTFQETPVVGKEYSLRISTRGNDVYESDFAVMPPVPTIDSLYTKDFVEKRYMTNAYHVPEMFETPGRQILIDAPLSPQLNHYLFDYQAVIQWYFSKAAIDSAPTPIEDSRIKQAFLDNSIARPHDTIWYGWITIKNTDEFNLAGPKDFSTSSSLQNHLLLWLDYRGGTYLDSTVQRPFNWIFTFEQYGITKASYDFRTKLNQQFTSDGTLLDPVLTQVTGNVHCVNNPKKVALGFFDLCSYKRYRYYLNLGSGPDHSVIIRKLNYFYDIPDRGFFKDKIPDFWETNYPK